MNMHKYLTFIILTAFICTNLLSAIPASAQSISALGEMKNTGQVYVQSSKERWTSALNSYPILQNSYIKTECGTSMLNFNDRSRAQLLNDTSVHIDGAKSKYAMKIERGTMTFNLNSATELTITANKSVVYINRVSGGLPGKTERSIGVISVTPEKIELRNISGKVQIQPYESSSPLILNSGDSILIGRDSKFTMDKSSRISKMGRNNDYKLKNNDCIRVETPNSAEIGRVDSLGEIDFMSVKRLKVGDLTLPDAEKVVAEKLAITLENTVVTIFDRCECICVPPAYYLSDRIATSAFILGGTYMFLKEFASPSRF